MRFIVPILLGLVAVIPRLQTTSRGPSDHERKLRIGGRERSYILHVPPATQSTPLPLVLAFHGGATNAQSMMRLAGLSETADREGFLVAYPNGTGRLQTVLTWNAGACCGYAVQQRVDDVAFVRAILDDVAAIARVDPSRIYATGISNGGQMAYRLAAEIPDRIAAIAPVAGSLEVPIASIRQPVPVMHFHGTDDDHLPFAGGRGTRSLAGISFASVDHSIGAWVKANGCGGTPSTQNVPDRFDDGTRVERRAYSACRDDADVVLFVIHGGGHTWPGRPIAERLLGVTTKEISATDLMWEFLQKHSRRAG